MTSKRRLERRVDDGEGAGALEMLVDDGPLGYVEVLEIEIA